jgi:hypothetical protein
VQVPNDGQSEAVVIDDRNVGTVDGVLAFRMPAFKPWSIVLTRAGQEITLKRK